MNTKKRTSFLCLLVCIIGFSVFVGYCIAPSDSIVFFVVATFLIGVIYAVLMPMAWYINKSVAIIAGLFTSHHSIATDHTSRPLISRIFGFLFNYWTVYLFQWLGVLTVFVFYPCFSSTIRTDYHCRLMCSNRLFQIKMAVENYHVHYDAYPPVCVYDKNGHPLISWRVLILPFIPGRELDDEYDSIHWDEPWDSPHNEKCLEKLHGRSYFQCPGTRSLGYDKECTNYLALIDDSKSEDDLKDISFSDVMPHSLKISIAEVRNSGIHWAEPKDLHVSSMSYKLNDSEHLGIGSYHRGLVHVLLNNGEVRYFVTEMPPEDVKKILDGTISPEALESE